MSTCSHPKKIKPDNSCQVQSMPIRIYYEKDSLQAIISGLNACVDRYLKHLEYWKIVLMIPLIQKKNKPINSRKPTRQNNYFKTTRIVSFGCGTNIALYFEIKSTQRSAVHVHKWITPNIFGACRNPQNKMHGIHLCTRSSAKCHSSIFPCTLNPLTFFLLFFWNSLQNR